MSKKKEYREYIKDHKKLVSLSWVELKKQLNLNFRVKRKINRNIRKHDNSKFSKEEFNGYRQFFYPKKNEEKDKEAFLMSWNYHQKRNPHHWEYWMYPKKSGETKVFTMPLIYVIEMICDWISMSVKADNLPSVWYEENKDRMILADETKITIDSLLKKADLVYIELRSRR